MSALNQSETEIHHIFSHHISTLCNQKWKIVDEITEWSNTLIRQIQEHVTVQRELLEDIYGKKVLHINNIRDKFLEQALIYEQKKESKQMHQLLNQCKILKFQLAELTRMERPISSIQLIAEEQITQQNRDEHNKYNTDDEQARKKRIKNQNNNNTDVIENSSPNTESTNQPSSITKSMNNENQSIISSYKFENHVIQHTNVIEKCPTCFMIFPQTMTTYDRHLHINEHYKDD